MIREQGADEREYIIVFYWRTGQRWVERCLPRRRALALVGSARMHPTSRREIGEAEAWDAGRRKAEEAGAT